MSTDAGLWFPSVPDGGWLTVFDSGPINLYLNDINPGTWPARHVEIRSREIQLDPATPQVEGLALGVLATGAALLAVVGGAVAGRWIGRRR